MFKRRRFSAEIILLCVRWYCRYGISYRDLEEMMAERGVAVDHVTLYRWVQRYAPELEKRVRWYQGYRSLSWRVDETYVRVGGKWKYLFRAVDKHGRLIDFMWAIALPSWNAGPSGTVRREDAEVIVSMTLRIFSLWSSR